MLLILVLLASTDLVTSASVAPPVKQPFARLPEDVRQWKYPGGQTEPYNLESAPYFPGRFWDKALLRKALSHNAHNASSGGAPSKSTNSTASNATRASLPSLADIDGLRSLDQFLPLFRRLEAGLPITVVALGRWAA